MPSLFSRFVAFVVELLRYLLRRPSAPALPAPADDVPSEPPAILVDERATMSENRTPVSENRTPELHLEVASEKRTESAPQPATKVKPMAFSSKVEAWRATLEEQANGIPINFLLSWLQHESGGNPCSVGFAGEVGRDGSRRFEAGIGQQFFQGRVGGSLAELMNVRVHGVSLATLRAPCSGQNPTRALTDDELRANVTAFLGDVEKMREKTHAQLSAVQAECDDESVEDFWQFVKLQHALPAIPIELLGPAKESGASDSFGRFRGFVEGLEPAELNKLARFSAPFAYNKLGTFVGLGRLFDNAEKTGRGSGVSFFDFAPSAKTLAANGSTVLPALALILLARFAL